MSVLNRPAVFAVLLFAAFFAAADTPSAGAKRPDRLTAAAEALVARLPQEKLNRAAGFFGPVVKKHLPTLKAFHREYAAASDKSAVIVKFAPKVDAVLADAKEMKVPPRFEKEKAEYIRLGEAFAFSLRMLTMFKKN